MQNNKKILDDYNIISYIIDMRDQQNGGTKMRTKKEIRATYREQKSMNRIEDGLILRAIENLRDEMGPVGGYYGPTQREIIDEAYEIQK